MKDNILLAFAVGAIAATIVNTVAYTYMTTNNSTIVTHKNCAYFHPQTRELVWMDENGSK